MAATHCVSLFLPNTIEWDDAAPAVEERPPTPPPPPPPPTPRTFTHTRHSSAIELSRRTSSQVSLLTRSSPPLTPAAAAAVAATTWPEDVFDQTGDHRDMYKLHYARPGDPRSLVRSDAQVLEWGQEERFNQPRSRAGPLPSRSILDFAKMHEQFAQLNGKANEKKDPPVSTTPQISRGGSCDRGYERRSWIVQPALQGNGGLHNAMRAVNDNGEAEISWVGTLGFPTDALPPSTKEEISDRLANDYQSDVVYTSDKDMDGHYTHYCKTILWPIFHYQVPDHPKSKAYADHSWEFYRNVNQAFADKVVASYKRGDTIWVHDYHLLLVPAMVRKQLPDAQIGFFLHTPFPSSEIFRCLSTRTELLRGMLGANLVAFQIDEYVQHFLQTCSRLLAVETTNEGVQLDDHFVNVTSQPIGINPRAIEDVRGSEDVAAWIAKITEQWKGKKLIVARDKFDSIHGIRQKLLGYELFLQRHPEWHNKVVLVQVATSTTAQAELFATVSDICTRIEQGYHTIGKGSPLMFLKQDLEFAPYLAMLSAADVLMVTSLRDGMNLTSHEFIYCQDGKLAEQKYGPIILSEFTGSAAVFGSDQISINPWDYLKLAEAIKFALEMGVDEKERRWSNLSAIVQSQTGERWAHELAGKLKKVHEEQSQMASTSVPRLSTSQICDKYRQAERRVFLIDYEGTLSPHKTTMGIPLSSPYRIIDTLKDLMSDPKNAVYVMSGKRPLELEAIFRTATGLGLIAENGCFIRGYGTAPHDWYTAVDLSEVKKWKTDVKMILRYYQERIEGIELEERHCSLIFRYAKVEDQDAALRAAGDCVDQINSSFKSTRVKAVPIQKAILIEQVEFSKGTAARHVFEELRKKAGPDNAIAPDFLVVVGDDREDEVVFQWANDLGAKSSVRDVFTVSVGKRNTAALATITQGSSGLLAMLQKLAKISMDDGSVDGLGGVRKDGA